MSISSKPLLSHPNKNLEEHLINVSKIVAENLNALPFQNVGFISRKIFAEIANITALSHDLGKATKFFQDYLINQKKNDDTRHALLSAIQTYFLVYNKLIEYKNLTEEEKIILSVISFMCVKRHHGSLDEFIGTYILEPVDTERLIRQTDSIDENLFNNVLLSLSNAGFPGIYKTSQIKDWIHEFDKLNTNFKLKIRKELNSKSLDYYLIENLLFSLLIDADKIEVTVGKNQKRSNIELSPTLVDKYKLKLKFEENKINILRNNAYNEITNKSYDLNQKIYSIHLPTGLGKTFASLSFALKLRNKLESEKGYKPRIIYSLPFMSIIDQNAEVFEDILKRNSITYDTTVLLKHHHLADVSYNQDESDYSIDDARILIEGWNSEIIITTFVQVFETLISNKNRSLKKFHRILNSILILDEIQAIPVKFWELLRQIFIKLTEEFNMYIIFVSATQPMIFKPQEIKPLANVNVYFPLMNRLKMKSNLNAPISLEEFFSTINLESDKSYLFILNTIQSAKKAYNLLREKVNEDIIYLSTHVIPYERLIRIHCLKRKKVRFAVTTQLIEAGVDIDFDFVYRDLAPLDSINQSAGRCNRNWSKPGIINVINMVDDKGKYYSSYIYDSILLEQTKKILIKNPEINESDFLNIMNLYYKEIKDRISSDKSKDILNSMKYLRYDSNDEVESINKFHLIEREPKLNIFIERNNEAKRIWMEFERISLIENKFDRKNSFDKIKSRFNKYLISVYENVKNIPPENEGIRYVSIAQLNDYYDKNTGYINESDFQSIW